VFDKIEPGKRAMPIAGQQNGKNKKSMISSQQPLPGHVHNAHFIDQQVRTHGIAGQTAT
jgi:hypothetical protein